MQPATVTRLDMDFLIIGAMKSGTTTLYGDLSEHPGVFLPASKEPDLLLDAIADPARFAKRLSRLYPDAADGRMRGEASTSYTKHPDVSGVAEAARERFGENLKLIYIVRDPLERVRSHYDHALAAGETDDSLSAWLRADEAPIRYSRYREQIVPWRRVFPEESLLVVNFERYAGGRQRGFDLLCDFLGLDRHRLGERRAVSVLNGTRGKPLPANRLVAAIVHSRLYGDVIKPRLPRELHRLARRALSRTHTLAASTLSEAERAYLLARIDEEDFQVWREAVPKRSAHAETRR